MVGSVLMDRMRAENDFAFIEPEFFMSHPANGANGRGDNQAFFPSAAAHR